MRLDVFSSDLVGSGKNPIQFAEYDGRDCHQISIEQQLLDKSALLWLILREGSDMYICIGDDVHALSAQPSEMVAFISSIETAG